MVVCPNVNLGVCRYLSEDLVHCCSHCLAIDRGYIACMAVCWKVCFGEACGSCSSSHSDVSTVSIVFCAREFRVVDVRAKKLNLLV